jgi:pimeloyl-ACP methyl ester carboxylesterase
MEGPTSHSYFSQRLRLHYVDWGNEGAPPLLLIHGGRDHCRNWDWVAEALRDDYHIIAPDLRGHGDSQWMKGGSYNHVDYVYDIAQLLHQTKMNPVTIVSHSLGGSIALMYAGLFPETVTRLVAIEGMGPPPEMIKDRINVPIEDRLQAWVADLRKASGRIPRRYDSLENAYERMQTENPHLSEAQARHLTIHGSNQNDSINASPVRRCWFAALSPGHQIPQKTVALKTFRMQKSSISRVPATGSTTTNWTYFSATSASF